MLNVKPYEQIKSGFCGPAALKMVFGYYGIEKSEAEIGRLSNCSVRRGTSVSGILKAVRAVGLKGFVRDFCDISDILKYVKKRIPVIVNWFSHDNGHYSVAVGIDGRNIYFQDPEIGKIREMSLKKFKTVWFDFPGDFLKSKRDVVIRRMIVINND